MKLRDALRASAIAATVLAFAACLGSKPPPPSTDIDETVYRDHLRVLASDDFEGRRPGTRGEEKTVAYLSEQFRKLGLKPLPDKSFVQPVPLVELTTSSALLSVQGSQGTRALDSGRDAVLWSQRSESTVRLSSSPVVFVGFGIVAPEYSWNDYAGVDVHGKTVLVLLGDPGPGAKQATLFKGSALTAYGRWEYKVEEAARQGAAGILLVHDPVVLGLSWQAVRNTFGGPQLKLAAGGVPAPALEAWLSLETARSLFAESPSDFAAATAAAGQPGFKAFETNLRLDASLSIAARSFTSNNVLAMLPGSAHKDEYVVFVAHWDSLGQDTALSGHNIFNGATDNASGVAGLLTMAQSFKRTQPAPERSMVFLATSAGVPGYLGATHYLMNPVYPLRQTAAVIDVESLLPGGHTRDITIFGAGNSDLDESARGAALLQGRDTRPDPFPALGLYYRSEAYVFAKSGIPAMYALSGADNAARGPTFGMAQRQDFMARIDHQPADQYSPDSDVRGALDDLGMYYEVGLRVARAGRFPRWRAASEFRSARQRPDAD